MEPQYNPNSPYFDYYSGSSFFNNPQRFNTGSASPQMLGAAAQLRNQNVGTQFAQQMRAAADRSAGANSRNALNAAYSQGAGGNYNLTTGIQNRFQNTANDDSQAAFARGAAINQQGVADAGKLYGQASEINQAGNRDAENYVSRFKPEQTQGYYGEYGPFQQQNQEGFFPALAKGLVGGAANYLTGGLAGGLLNGLFKNNGQNNGGGLAAPYRDGTFDPNNTGAFSMGGY